MYKRQVTESVSELTGVTGRHSAYIDEGGDDFYLESLVLVACHSHASVFGDSSRISLI